MSFANVRIENPYFRLERVLKNQKRLLAYNVAAAVLLTGGILASLASLL